jgi:hypothetical protein
MAEEVESFFLNRKIELTLIDIKPKLNKENEKRVRFDFSMPLTAEVLEGAPKNVQEAFYAAAKDNLGINKVGIATEFEDVSLSFFFNRQN